MSQRLTLMLVVALLVLGLAAALVWQLRSPEQPAPVARLAVAESAGEAAPGEEPVRRRPIEEDENPAEEGHAWEMFEWWYDQRAYPNRLIPKSAFHDAFVYARENLAPEGSGGLRDAVAPWLSIGPDNVGGRMLSLAIDPTDTDVIWSGAASGGLWRSTTAGEGASAWERIETGYPALSVSAIVIDPTDVDVMYIGTGEISRYERPLVGTPGARSSYGLGILKTEDGGFSWDETDLTWTFDQSRAVLAMRIDPTDAQTLWAATSEGLYKTTDGGTNWTLAHDLLMAMDVVLDPTDPDVVYVTHGQLGVPAAPDAGIYKSTNGGSSWTQLGGGLPTTDFGRTPLAISTDGKTVKKPYVDIEAPADIGLDTKRNRLLVPLFNDKKVLIYPLVDAWVPAAE
jgi:hypothetical protein